MALQFRRGTDAERQQFEFAEGEPIYVTDTGELYIGDGETQGGRRVLSSLSEESDPELGGNLDLNDNNIVGAGNIAIDGNLSVLGLGRTLDLNGFNIIGQGSINIDGTITATGDINLGDGAEDNVIVGGQISSPLTPAEDGLYDLGSDSLRWRNGYFEGLEVDGEITAGSIAVDTIYATDSTVLWNTSSNELQADLRGSVYAQDSGIIVDSETGDIFATDIDTQILSASDLVDTLELTAGKINTGEISAPEQGKLSISPTTSGNQMQVQVRGNESDSFLRLTKVVSSDIDGEPGFYGQISFERDDVNGPLTTTLVSGAERLLFFVNDSTGTFEDSSKWVGLRDGLLGIGTIDAEERLDVHGNCIIRGNFTSTNLNITESAEITGELTASAIKGSIVGDDSTIIIDAVNNTITSGGFIQFGSYTDTNRPTGENGMVIYNTTVNRFQGYQNNAWINLDDGSLA